MNRTLQWKLPFFALESASSAQGVEDYSHLCLAHWLSGLLKRHELIDLIICILKLACGTNKNIHNRSEILSLGYSQMNLKHCN